MYDYEYEQDALLALRLLKFLHQQDKDVLYNLLKEFECSNIEYLVRCAEFSVWEIFSDVTFTTDPEWDTDIATFSHPTIDRFYDLGNRWCVVQRIDRNASLRLVGRSSLCPPAVRQILDAGGTDAAGGGAGRHLEPHQPGGQSGPRQRSQKQKNQKGTG